MDITRERFLLSEKALKRLQSTLKRIEQNEYCADFEEMRDAAIQRFEFSIDTFWKFLHAYMQEVEKLSVQGPSSPRSTFKYALQVGNITDNEYKACINMIEDRNRTSHTYNEQTAHEIFKQLPQYLSLLHTLLERFESEIKNVG